MNRPKRWGVTQHALDRFIERVEPGMRRAVAREVLARLAESAVLVGYQEHRELYRDPRRPMAAEFLVVDGRVITVLDPTEQPIDRDQVVAVKGGSR